MSLRPSLWWVLQPPKRYSLWERIKRSIKKERIKCEERKNEKKCEEQRRKI